MIRPVLDFFIFLSQHTLLTFAGLLVLLMLIGRKGPLGSGLGSFINRRGSALIFSATLLLLVIFVLVSGWYLQLQGFAGEVEPMISSLSWMVQDGHPLYHDLDSPARYSVLYGPSVFLTNGLFLKILGPSLFSSKLASALAGLASLLLLYSAVQDRKRGTVGILVVGLAVMYFWCQGFAVYLVRPDSLLLLSVSLGLFSILRVRRILGLVAVGAVLGFAINLKVHAGLYFLPILAIQVKRYYWPSLGWTGIALGLSVLAPFVLHDQISLANYLIWLGNAAGHGLSWESVPLTSRYALGLLIPLGSLIILHPSPQAWLRQQWLLVVSLLVALGGVMVLAAKPGAGLVHLLPLVPVFLYADAQLLHQIAPRTWALPELPLARMVWARGALAAMLLTVVMAGAIHEYRICRLVAWENQEAKDLVIDIADIQAAYPGLTIGMAVGGEEQCFRYTWMRPLLVFHDNPLLLDPIAVMDCQLSGQGFSPETYAALSRGEVAVWLVPKAQRPFAKLNWYPPHEQVFPRDFMEHFQSNYTVRSRSRFFDLWIWNGLSGEDLGEPALAARAAM